MECTAACAQRSSNRLRFQAMVCELWARMTGLCGCGTRGWVQATPIQITGKPHRLPLLQGQFFEMPLLITETLGI